MSAGIVIQPGINGYAPEFDTRPAYSPDAAKGLLAEAGYPDGFTVGLDCPKDRYLNDEAICKAVEGMLAKVGIAVELAIAPMGEHIAKLCERHTDFDMLGLGTQTFDSHDHFAYLHRSDGQYNATGYARVDEQIDSIGTELMTYARDAAIEEVADGAGRRGRRATAPAGDGVGAPGPARAVGRRARLADWRESRSRLWARSPDATPPHRSEAGITLGQRALAPEPARHCGSN